MAVHIYGRTWIRIRWSLVTSRSGYQSIHLTVHSNGGLSKQNWTGLIALGKILTLILCMTSRTLSFTPVCHEKKRMRWKRYYSEGFCCTFLTKTHQALMWRPLCYQWISIRERRVWRETYCLISCTTSCWNAFLFIVCVKDVFKMLAALCIPRDL